MFFLSKMSESLEFYNVRRDFERLPLPPPARCLLLRTPVTIASLACASAPSSSGAASSSLTLDTYSKPSGRCNAGFSRMLRVSSQQRAELTPPRAALGSGSGSVSVSEVGDDAVVEIDASSRPRLERATNDATECGNRRRIHSLGPLNPTATRER